jgi:hypothetical protein
MAAYRVYALALPLLDELISIILGAAFSAIAYAVILPKVICRFRVT